MLFNIFEPVLDIPKRLLVRHVVNQHYAHCISIMQAGDGPEALLPSRVQQLELGLLAFKVDLTNFKIDSDGWRAVNV